MLIEKETGSEEFQEESSFEIGKLFANMVEFIYTGDLAFADSSAIELLHLMILAETFRVEDLKERWADIKYYEDESANLDGYWSGFNDM